MRHNFTIKHYANPCIIISLMKKLILTIVSTCLLSSCIIINDDGYRFLSDEEKTHVKVLDKSINDLANDGNIYRIDISQMQDFLNSHEKVIVYEYLSYCKSDHCLSPAAIEDMCIKAGITPCLVLQSYSGAFMLPKMKTPVLVVDKENYKKKEYCKQFFDDLTNTTYKTRGYGRYYYFRNGQYIKCIDNILTEDLSVLE